ncbi:MAG TPA: SCP2 sterol-binding domain-containing protein [Burkholderiaceae bacterium]|jgi:ubiquinone biosynthesis protein UbiJ|nr:SCP2 sterol-binding domain-containing protein [Burkholderiaceae bacterium]
MNHLLAQEPWARAKLAVHQGKTACFDLSVLRINLMITVDGMVSLAEQDAAPSNVTIRIKPEQLPLILQNRERAFSYVTVEGDADFANTISQVSQSLQWEAEEDLSKLVGDIAAIKIVAGAKTAFQTVKATNQALAENVAEYFLEEKPMLVRPQTVMDFGGDVAKMRDDVERLIKRIEKLEGRRQ